MTLRDPDIRARLIADIEASGDIAVGEFTVPGARVDVARISGSALTAYEIKSDVDTHARLQGQTEAYDRVCTHLYLVTTPKKLAKMEPILPPWWGVLIADETSKGVTLREHRDSRGNPAWTLLSALELLWGPEMDAIIDAHGMPSRAHKPKAVKRKRIASTLGTDVGREIWLSTLRTRYTLHPDLRGPGKPTIL